MPRLAYATASLFLFAPISLLSAGEYNEVLSIGDEAPSWKDLPGADDKKHSLADLAKKDVLVVVFTCNSCPVAQAYEDRIAAFADKHAAEGSRVGLVAINCNKIDEDRLPAIRQRAAAKGFHFAYLHDESQQIGRDFGAVFTPEFFVLDRDRKVVYMGAMDDNGDAEKATINYVVEAVTATLAGKQPQVRETLARGCRVRYKRTAGNK
ncbi:MAG TPA: thioredoxin family protein [Pirellulales bacterium]|nr:thioredoxin family protein [Pirellulales bacterium]